MASYTYCREDSEFYPIFGDEAIPIQSVLPITPREDGAPPCYVVLVEQLSNDIVETLAQMLFEKWQPECENIEMAKDYMVNGLPIMTTHFRGIGTDEYSQMLVAAVVEMSIRSAYENENESIHLN